MEPLPNNTRYQLELERKALLNEKYELDEKYGTFSFAFLTSLEAFALLAYLYIATVLIYYKKTRTKTNFVVSVWALINFAVLLEKLSRAFGPVIGYDFLINEDVGRVSEMTAGVGRCYGTMLSIVWLFSKFFGKLRSQYDGFVYFSISVPAGAFVYYVYYYFAINKYIYEAYAPACDVVNAVVYLLVGFLFILGKIFANSYPETTLYALLLSLVNLITNLPLSLMTIYIRFNLDIKWTYKFHLYFVDFFFNALNCSAAFVALFLIILYNEELRQFFYGKKKNQVFHHHSEEIEVIAVDQND